MKEKQAELLAPAGSYESMTAAFMAGADAVYIGGSRFGARAYADNPDEELLLRAIDYAHLHNRKLYMTVNTLVKEDELGELYDFLRPYYERGVDAVIVQDMGVFLYIREHFPDLPIHVSTQMTITGAYGAKLLQALGAERVVTARELSLAEIRQIHHETDIEIETFVHGALCYCYSGQCLFSSMIGGRSGNRGRCAQPCRLPYDVKKDGKPLTKGDNRYVLSLKDLCTLDLIPDLLEAGVYSMKIEGRMKSPRYTAGVVSIYRKYVDLYLEKGRSGYKVEAEDKRLLLDLFDRGGFTDGYLKQHNGKDMIALKEKPAFREGNQTLFDYLDRTYVQAKKQEAIDGTLTLEAGKPAVLELSRGKVTVKVQGEPPQAALKQPLTREKAEKQMLKTGNSPFVFQTLNITITGDLFLPLQALNELRRRGMEALETGILKQCQRNVPEKQEEGNFKTEHNSSLEEGNFKADNSSSPEESNFKAGNSSRLEENRDQQAGQADGGMELAVSLEDPRAFAPVLNHKDVSQIYLDATGFPAGSWKDHAAACHAAGKQCLLVLPHIFRTEAKEYFLNHMSELGSAGFDGVLLRSLEEQGFLEEQAIDLPMVFDYSLYSMNHLAVRALKQLGAARLTLPVELNSRELGKLSKGGELIAYGHIPMMVTAQCVQKTMEGCRKTPVVMRLRDRMGKEFPVKNHCRFCYNTIYNSSPLSLLGQEEMIKKLKPSVIRLQFTIETPEETIQVIRGFAAAFLHGQQSVPQIKDFTRGHFKRGIE